MTAEWSQTADGDENIDGRYQRFKCIGRGSFKHVYAAFDTHEQKDVAWNVVDLSDVSELEKIKKETEILKKLSHKNILRIHNTWLNKERDKLIFITDIMRDRSLLTYIMNRDIILGRVKQYCKQILCALQYLHNGFGKPIIHRDIKCDNIFIDAAKNQIVLGDLGLSTLTDCTKSNKGRSVVGTAEFMAPEMYEEKYNEKVDIYAFGMCVLQMITKKLPYQECHSLHQVYKKVMGREMPAAYKLIASKSMKEFIMSCCQFKAEFRPNAQELLLHPFLNYHYPNDYLSCSDSRIVGSPLEKKLEEPVVRKNKSSSHQLPPQKQLSPVIENPSKETLQTPSSRLCPTRSEEEKFRQWAPSPGMPPSPAGVQIVKAEKSESRDQIQIMLKVVCGVRSHHDSSVNLHMKNVSFDYVPGVDTASSVAQEMVNDLGLEPKDEMLTAIEGALSGENIKKNLQTLPRSMIGINEKVTGSSPNKEQNNIQIQPETSKPNDSIQRSYVKEEHASTNLFPSANIAEAKDNQPNNKTTKRPKTPLTQERKTVSHNFTEHPKAYSKHKDAGFPQNLEGSESRPSINHPVSDAMLPVPTIVACLESSQSSYKSRVDQNSNYVCTSPSPTISPHHPSELDNVQSIACVQSFSGSQARMSLSLPQQGDWARNNLDEEVRDIAKAPDGDVTGPAPIEEGIDFELPRSKGDGSISECNFSAEPEDLVKVDSQKPSRIAGYERKHGINQQNLRCDDEKINSEEKDNKARDDEALKRKARRELFKRKIMEEEKKLQDESFVPRDAVIKPKCLTTKSGSSVLEEGANSPGGSSRERGDFPERKKFFNSKSQKLKKTGEVNRETRSHKTVNSNEHIPRMEPLRRRASAITVRERGYNESLVAHEEDVLLSSDVEIPRKKSHSHPKSDTKTTRRRSHGTALIFGGDISGRRSSAGRDIAVDNKQAHGENLDRVLPYNGSSQNTTQDELDSQGANEFESKVDQHRHTINNKMQSNRKKVMDEYRQRLDEISEHMAVWHHNEKEKTTNPKLRLIIDEQLRKFQEQFERMKEESLDFENNPGT